MQRKVVIGILVGAVGLLLVCGLFGLAVWLVRGQLSSRIEQALAGPLPPEPLVGQLGGGILTCVVRDDYAYVGIGHHLAVLDIRDPARPALVGQAPALPRPVENIALYDRYAYILDSQVGLRIVDVGDPVAPREVGLVRIGRGMNKRVATAGHYAYVADFDKLYTLDLQDPLQPVQVSVLTALFVPGDLVVADGYAYVLGSINIRAFRLPSSQTGGIRQAGFYDHDFFSVFLDARAADGHLFLADESDGLIVLDLSKVLGQPER